MSIIILDVEANDLENADPIEVVYDTIDFIDGSVTVVDSFGPTRYKPSREISISAMAVHHIMDEDLVDCQPASDFSIPDDVDFIVGHNVDYDCNVVKAKSTVKRICTLAMARHIWPTIAGHSLGALLYFLDRENARDILKSAHTARADVDICTEILGYILKEKPEIKTIEELYAFSEFARIPTVMPIGKHRGMPIKDLPTDYKKWMLRQTDFDPYIIEAVRRSCLGA